jgi:serine/threonine protein kinase/Tol biopolymer transport system component
MTDSETWKRAEELYHAALEQEEDRRAAFLERACAGDEALLREVRSLLGHAQSAERFLEAPAAEAATQGPKSAAGGIGQRLSHYEIVSPIGSGGMGDVYRAKDLLLGREVAIKLMRKDLSSDPERLRRFEREARAAAALNHPNIATIYEIGDHEGTRFIAMELLEGRTLHGLLEQGPLPLGELLRVGTQIAAGLARAHAAGIVHRDLKPANLMIADDGAVKILDFGLAKLTLGNVEAVPEVTRAGMVLGTAPYMSPEQAAGRPVDFRSDQFSFGSILYEMATGHRPFARDSIPQTLAAIIESDPTPVDQLDERLPAALVRVITRCLAKAAEGRYDSTADLARELALASAPAAHPTRASKRWLPVAGLMALTAAAAFALLRHASRPGAPEAPETPLVAVPLTSSPGLEMDPTFSPDGSQVAFSWDGEKRDNEDIYVKAIGSELPLRLTTDPAQEGSPAWSPDGRRIAFLRARAEGGSEVRLIPPTGGPGQRLAEVAAAAGAGLSWSPDGRHLAVPDRTAPDGPGGLFLLDAERGSLETLVSPPAGVGVSYVHPAFSPDGRTVAFKSTDSRLLLVAASGGEPTELAPAFFLWPIAWLPGGGEIVFGTGASALDGAAPVPAPGWSGSRALWRVPADGGWARLVPGPVNVAGVAVSRQGNRLVYAQYDSRRDIWRIDLQDRGPSGGEQTRFIASTKLDGNPRFSPDDERVAFTSGRSGHNEVWVADSEGKNAFRLTSIGETGELGSPRWSPDGASIAFDFHEHGEGQDLNVYVVSASGGQPRPITKAPSKDCTPTWSRDGRFVYFSSNRSGQWQVWRVPSDGKEEGSARQVTRGGGFAPLESTDGRHLYFCRRFSHRGAPGNAIWRVPVEGGDEEVVIESLRSSWGNWDETAEGIYFVDEDTSSSGRQWVVRLFRFDRRRAVVVSRLRDPPFLDGPAFDVSSDGRWALFMQEQRESDLMLVENFR